MYYVFIFREWRFQTCSYLGQASVVRYKTGCLESDWSAAYYFNEAMSISTRQLARTILRSFENNQTFHFEHVEKFQEAVRSLPSGNPSNFLDVLKLDYKISSFWICSTDMKAKN